MPDKPEQYDVFISYASEDSKWVKEELCTRLRQCQTADGRMPRVFLDVDTIPPGSSWKDVLSQAINHSRSAVAVYSRRYFEKGMTNWELDQMVDCFYSGQMGMVPVAIETDIEVPPKVGMIHYLGIEHDDWFERVAQSLGLTSEIHRPSSLMFLDQPENTVAKHTLKTVRVALLDEDNKPLPSDERVTMSADPDILQGTLAVDLENGVATFSDLSIGEEVTEVRLLAHVQGIDPVYSQCFEVASPALKIEEPSAVSLAITDVSSACFFPSGNALVAVSPNIAFCIGVDGKERGRTPLEGHIRLFRMGPGVGVMAFWQGHILLLGEDGRRADYDPQADKNSGFRVPGDAVITDESVYVGYWRGDIYHLSLDGMCEHLFSQQTGVQAMAVSGGKLCIADFDGTLSIYENNSLIRQHNLERTIMALRNYGDVVVAVGEQKLYRLTMASGEVLYWPHSLDHVEYVLKDTELPVLTDANGQGIRFDKSLAIQNRFHTTQGARPVSADDNGQYSVFHHPDGSHSLIVEKRVVYSQKGGALAVAPDGRHFALGMVDKLQIVNEVQMRERFGDATHA